MLLKINYMIKIHLYLNLIYHIDHSIISRLNIILKIQNLNYINLKIITFYLFFHFYLCPFFKKLFLIIIFLLYFLDSLLKKKMKLAIIYSIFGNFLIQSKFIFFNFIIFSILTFQPITKHDLIMYLLLLFNFSLLALIIKNA